ncbi:MAG: triose-phosphate isomerase [Gammaproteobacteria bacterium]|jgi:triosephosphate isomerase|nr:MAG: triose-phosphate isomerase [Gammaproteobacteria bacterium]
MTRRQPLVAANWKMNGALQTVRPLIAGVLAGVADGIPAEVAICPPFVYLPEVGRALQGSRVALGAQNVSEHAAGAHTGEIAAAMLMDLGCKYVIVGHSERRHIYGETNVIVAGKFVSASRAGLIPILCVGEELSDREAGQTEEVVANQLDAVIQAAGIGSFAAAVVAYEPVWAIGTGKVATPDQAQQVHAFIRLRLARHDTGIADRLRILYGGSVKAGNAKELFAMADIDGGLIGGASLQAEEFIGICRAAE